MTAEELMILVSRYAEACDDLWQDLYDQPAEVRQERAAKAHAVWTQIDVEVKRLHAAPAAPALVLTDAQIDAAVEAWFEGATGPGKVESFESRMRAAFKAAHGIKP